MIHQGLISPSTRVVAAGSSVPIGAYARVWTEGRNDMVTSQIMMFHWVVWSPYIGPAPPPVLNYTDKTAFGVPPGGLEYRKSTYFYLNESGQWIVLIELLMNPDDPVVVDSYSGLLCVVSAAPPPVYVGRITRKELEYDGIQESIPVY